jgi:hypothetical protein
MLFPKVSGENYIINYFDKKRELKPYSIYIVLLIEINVIHIIFKWSKELF